MYIFIIIILILSIVILYRKITILKKKQIEILQFLGIEDDIILMEYNEQDNSVINKLSLLFSQVAKLDKRYKSIIKSLKEIDEKNTINQYKEKNKFSVIEKFLDIRIKTDNVEKPEITKLYPQQKFYLRNYDSEGFFWDEYKEEKKDDLFSFYIMKTFETDPYKAYFEPLQNKVIMSIALANPEDYLDKACIFLKDKKVGASYEVVEKGILTRKLDKWIIIKKCKIEVNSKNN